MLSSFFLRSTADIIPWLLVLSLLMQQYHGRVTAFVVPSSKKAATTANTRTSSSSGSPSFTTTELNMVKLPASSLPIPPPPPPTEGGIEIQNILKDVTSSFDSIELPKFPDELGVGGGGGGGGLLGNFKSQMMSSLDTTGSKGIISELNEMATNLETSIQQQIQQLLDAANIDTSAIDPILNKIQSLLQPILNAVSQFPPAVTLALTSIVTFVIVNQIIGWVTTTTGDSDSSNTSTSSSGATSFTTAVNTNTPYPNGRYDPVAAKIYFDKRLPQVLSRAVTIAFQSLQFGLSLLVDKVEDKIDERSEERAIQLAELLTTLGPSFIKIGQSLSIRTDLLSPAYVRGLSSLQDQVPPFSTDIAREILEQEWNGRRISDIIDGPLTSEPVAAASLGQVYKAKLKGSDQEVAIKVQRPDIMEQIALDMHLLREFAPIAKTLFNLNTDTVGTVDTWGAGFVDELDYYQEATNAQMFMEQIANTPVSEVVFAPTVVDELSTGKVLVTEWIDGERLDKSDQKDVSILCSIAMNTYLTMLLELGVLHADPHPGNLLRTPEGKLCILDWGMVTRIDKDLQLTLIEHVAHLTSADYDEIPRDLLLLGFIPEDKADLIRDSGVVELLADIYGSWTAGGGAASVNVNDVISRLQDLTAEKGNLFQIPPYFAYIAKSFSVLEGIGLSNDPKYSIVNECLPYVSKRLLTDHERLGPALNTFIFGSEKDNKDRIVDYERVEQLVEGFGEYTTSVSGALLGKDSDAPRTELLEAAATQILELVFTEEETPLQDILLDQLAKIITSESRSVYTRMREQSGVLPSGRTVLGSIIDPFGLWRTSPLVRMNDIDELTVETTRKLIALGQKQIEANSKISPALDLSTLSRQDVVDFTSILVRKVWQRRTGIVRTGNRFARKLLELTADSLFNGERDTRRLAAVGISSSSPDEPRMERLEESRSSAGQPLVATAVTPASTATASRTFGKELPRTESARLQKARKWLDEFDQEEEMTSTITATPAASSTASSSNTPDTFQI